MNDFTACNLCPRQCGIDRTQARGACHAGAEMTVVRAALHPWEEPPISGTNGSGTVFFSGCNLGCIYCQNREISRSDIGRKVSPAQLAQIFADLQKEGAHNINLVTPTHYWPLIRQAVALFGKQLPIVYNTSGYETPQAIQALADTVDIYLTDLKYAEPEAAQAWSRAPDYPAVARTALQAMVETVGPPQFDAEGMMQKGVLVRLLVLPSIEHEAMMNLKYLKQQFGDQIAISIMNQYTPVGEHLPPELQQPLPAAAYQTVVDYARSLHFKYAYIQEGETAKESFIPPFRKDLL